MSRAASSNNMFISTTMKGRRDTVSAVANLDHQQGYDLRSLQLTRDWKLYGSMTPKLG